MINLHSKLFFLLVLFLPTQLGFHFWPSWASVFGIRVDYLAPTVYLTDILVVGILLSWWWEQKNFKFLSHKPTYYILLSTFYLLATSLLLAQNQGVALYKLVKFIEFLLLGLYVFRNWKLEIGNWKFRAALSAAMLYSSIIAWLQFMTGHTIGGFFWFLGERTFDINTPGIALVTISGQDYLRPYATFPHPNVLAGFLLIGILLMNGRIDKWRLDKKGRLIYSSIYLFSIFTIIITFSHSAWIAGLAALALLNFRSFHKYSKVFTQAFVLGTIVLSLALPAFSRNINNSNVPEEIGRRIDLSRVAMSMVVDYPLTGVGLGNFVVHLPEHGTSPAVSWWLQPVHNIFLLVLAETGLAGFCFLLYFLFFVLKRLFTVHYSLITLFLVILITGTVDHYWLTLQQGQLMLAIVLGASFSATIKG